MNDTTERRTTLRTRTVASGPTTSTVTSYGYADGTGGFAIVEADNAADLARTMAPWVPFLQFEAKVILPIQEATAINLEAMNWRDGIK